MPPSDERPRKRRHKRRKQRERLRPRGKQILPSWEQQEAAGTERRGAARVPGSGAGHRKGDVRTELFLDESKTTGAASISVKRAWLEKIAHEAQGEGKFPSLTFGFDGDPRLDWTAAPADLFAKLERITLAALRGDLEAVQALALEL